MVVEPNTELRKLRFAELCHLGQILNISDSWKKLMATVTKEGTDNVPRFTGEHITMIEQAARQQRRSAAEIFLEEWATMGKNRPTLSLLLDLLMKTHLFRAADYLAQDILKGEAPQRPSFGPAAPVDISEAAIADLLQRQHLNDETITNDSNFCLRTTAQIRLSQIDYPTSIFDSENPSYDNNCRIYENDVGVIDMQYAESKSNLILDHARRFQNPDASENCQFSKPIAENSNLIEFSVSEASNGNNESRNPNEYTKSDLIKFQSEYLNSDGSKEYKNVEIHESSLLPDLNVLRCDSRATGEFDEDSNVKANYEAVKKHDIFPKELPTCIEKFTNELPATVAEFPATVNYNRELMSAELPLCINERIGLRSSDNNLNTDKKLNSSEGNSFNDLSFHETQSNLSSSSNEAVVSTESTEKMEKRNTESTFPRFLTDTRKYKEQSNESKDKNDFEQKNKVLQSQELPITVLEFHQR